MRRLAVVFGVVLALVPFVGAGTAGAAGQTIDVKLTDAGCPKRLTAEAGSATFEVKNVDANKVTEFEVLDGKRVVGEKENLTPGLSGSFTVTLRPGKYTTLCPNGDREKGVLVVTGAATATTAAVGPTTRVPVRLTEYTVQPTPTSVTAGNVTFVVKNAGSDTHELVLVRAASAAALPTDADGAVDEDQIPESAKLGELEDLKPGSRATFKAGALAPGSYVLFCNVVDKEKLGTVSHFALGMASSFQVG